MTVGIFRNIDDLGRIVLPMELRRCLSIDDGDSLEMFCDDKLICLRKYYGKGCIFCNSADEVSQFKGKLICRNCLISVRSPYTDKIKPAEAAAEKNDAVIPIVKPRKKRAPRRTAIEMIKEMNDLLDEYPDLTQKKLAARLNVSPGRISQIMNMKNPLKGAKK